jgi:hypothetical protein
MKLKRKSKKLILPNAKKLIVSISKGVVRFKDGDYRAMAEGRVAVSTDKYFIEATAKKPTEELLRFEIILSGTWIYINNEFEGSNVLIKKDEYYDLFIDNNC